MKKLLVIFLAVTMVLSLAACTPNEPASAPVEQSGEAETPDATAEGPVAEEVRGVTIPAFAVAVNGKVITEAEMAAYPMYSVQATSINSAGTESNVTYVGFTVADLLDAAGLNESYTWIEAAADDGYTVDFSDAALITADTTLLALTRDGSPFDAAPWFAPCTNTTTGNYLKGCVSIIVNTSEGKPEGVEHSASQAGSEGGVDTAVTGELPEILDRTDKVEFSEYSFLVNGVEVTNSTLAGLSIYKIDATAVNSKGESSTSGYTGYKLQDVLAACNITGATKVTAIANDGYENEIDSSIIESEYTLVAIEKDKELGEDGTIWLAPCSLTESKAYSKLVVEIKAE